MLENRRVAVLGSGKLGEVLITGLLEAKLIPPRVLHRHSSPSGTTR